MPPGDSVTRIRGGSPTRVVAALLTVVAVAGACRSEDGTSAKPSGSSSTSTTAPKRAADDGHLAIGQLAPITGPVATISKAFTTPVQLAVDEMNIDGGVNGAPVTLSVLDDASDPAMASAALTALARDVHVDGVVGPSSSEVAATLIPELRDRHVAICSGSNTAGALSTMDSGGFYFRTAPPDRLQAVAMAQLLQARGHTKPVVVTSADAYGDTFGRQVLGAMRRARLRPTRVRATTDPAPFTEAVRAASPDSVVLVGFPDGIAPALRALVVAGLGPQQIPTFGTDGLQTADLGPAVDPTNPSVVVGLHGTTPSGAPAGIDHPFNARMLVAGVEPFFSAGAYDCAILLGLAAVAAGSDDAAAVRDHFAANLAGRTPCSNFHDCADLLRRKRTIHYQGAFSAYDRWRRTEPGSGVFDVWTIGLDGRPGLEPPANQVHVR